MIEFYVYYRIAAANAEAVQAIVGGWPEVRLLKRPENADGLQTWMEIHRGPGAEASEQALAALLAPHIAGSRHVERFVPVLPDTVRAT